MYTFSKQLTNQRRNCHAPCVMNELRNDDSAYVFMKKTTVKQGKLRKMLLT